MASSCSVLKTNGAFVAAVVIAAVIVVDAVVVVPVPVAVVVVVVPSNFSMIEGRSENVLAKKKADQLISLCGKLIHRRWFGMCGTNIDIDIDTDTDIKII